MSHRGSGLKRPTASQNKKHVMTETSNKQSVTNNVVDLDTARESAELGETFDDVLAAGRDGDRIAMPRLVELRQHPQQQQLPFAIVQGEHLTELPTDLYIPPLALEVFLEAFEGPLDFLLYLIKRHNLDILEIDVAKLTEQYMQYVRLMNSMQFELAAEYLVMAATLTEIKSRMLLPRSQEIADDDEDPRVQLIKRLQEYERFKQAAEDIEELPRLEREIFVAEIEPPADDRPVPQPDINLKELLLALGDVLHRADMFESHHISLEPLSTRERMGNVLDMLQGTEDFISFAAFFNAEEGRAGVVVTFLAIMELIKESLIEIVQAEAFAPIHIRARAA